MVLGRHLLRVFESMNTGPVKYLFKPNNILCENICKHIQFILNLSHIYIAVSYIAVTE